MDYLRGLHGCNKDECGLNNIIFPDDMVRSAIVDDDDTDYKIKANKLYLKYIKIKVNMRLILAMKLEQNWMICWVIPLLMTDHGEIVQWMFVDYLNWFKLK